MSLVDGQRPKRCDSRLLMECPASISYSVGGSLGRSTRFCYTPSTNGIHYDHTGGLIALLDDRPQLYLHPAALERRFSRRRDGTFVDIGMPLALPTKKLVTHAGVHWTEDVTEVVPGLFVTGHGR